MNMCETGLNNTTFTSVQQKIEWDYIESYLWYTDFA